MKIHILGKTRSFYESRDSYEVQEIIQAYVDRIIAEAEMEVREMEETSLDDLYSRPAYWIEECELIV